MLIFKEINDKAELASLLTVCRDWGNLIVELLWFRPSLDEKTLDRIKYVMKKDKTTTFWNYRRYIRRLNLSFLFDLVDDAFLLLFADCVNLERLTLVNCSKITDKSISTILNGCTKLQSIDLSGVYKTTDDILLALARNCDRLQGLYAPDCSAVTNEAIVEVINNCPLLKRVKISDNGNINDNGLILMSKKCKALIEVDVHGCSNLSDYALQRVFIDLEQLREFRVSHNQNVSDQILADLPDTLVLERLRIIDFTGCLRITDKLVDRIVQAAPRLRNVVLSKCSNITDMSLKSLAKLGKNLHYIHLGHCTNITDEGVSALVRSCHRLQYIDFACCVQLTNASLVELAGLPKLKRIGLVKCVQINDQGLLMLIQKRGYDDTLERVHLSYCTGIGIYPISQLLMSCPKLTHLSLTGVQAFLRPDILKFCRQPPADFNSNQRQLFCVFSGEGVKQLKEYLRSYLTGFPQLQPTHFDEVETQNTNPRDYIQRMNEMFMGDLNNPIFNQRLNRVPGNGIDAAAGIFQFQRMFANQAAPLDFQQIRQLVTEPDALNLQRQINQQRQQQGIQNEQNRGRLTIFNLNADEQPPNPQTPQTPQNPQDNND